MARSFNGTTDQISCGATINPTAITMSAWFYLPSSTSGYRAIYSTAATGNYQQILINPSKIAYYVYGSADIHVDPGATLITTGVWIHCALTYDSVGGLKTYFNGANDGTAAANGTLGVADAPLTTIGYDANSPGRNFPGRIADCAKWNIALTAAEIGALANGARPYQIRPANLFHWCPLDGYASPEPDYSGSKFNGTLTGTSYVSGPPLNLFTPRREVIQPPPVTIPPGEQFLVLPPPPLSPFAITHGTWTASYNLNLIGKDRLPAGDQWWQPPDQRPFPASLLTWTRDPIPNLLPAVTQFIVRQSDWQLPKGPPWDDYTWISQGILSLPVAPSQFIIRQSDWQLPKTPQWDDYTWIAQGILTLPAAPTTIPVNLLPKDWPLPRAPQWDDYTWLQQGILPAAAAVTVGPRGAITSIGWVPPGPPARGVSYNRALFTQGPVNQFDWPLAVSRHPGIDRSWTVSYLATLVGQDRLPTGAAIHALADQSRQTWLANSITASYNLNLIGKDKLPTGDQYYDRTPIGPTWLGNWVTSTSLNLLVIPPVQPPPGKQYSERTPLGSFWLANSVTVSYNQNLIGKDQLPVGDQYSELPKGITWRANDVTVSYNKNLIGQDKLPTGEQYSDRPPGPAWLANWVTSTSAALLAGPPQRPFVQTDWPLTAAPAVPQRSWACSYLDTLIGQDRRNPGQQSTALADQSSRQWLANWINSTSLALLVTVPTPPLPKNQYDWQVPRGPVQPDRSYGAVFPKVLIGKDQLPFRQRDWPLPTAPRPAADLITFINRSQIQLIGKDKLPIRQQDWPVPRPYPLLPRATGYNRPIGAAAALAAKLPFNQFDWPLPGAHLLAFSSMIARITNGRVLSGGPIPPVIGLGPVDHLRAYADSYYGVFFAEEVDRAKAYSDQHGGTPHERAGN
jgi:hypothetical protein